jgi:hypothetical protein
VGDPEEWIGATEFAAIQGWGSPRPLSSALSNQRLADLRERIQPRAAAVYAAAGDAAESADGGQSVRGVLRAVAEALEAMPAADPAAAAGQLADRLGLERAEVLAALRALARPVRRAAWKAAAASADDRRRVPEPDAAGRWRRREAWDFADGRRGPTPGSRPRRYSPQQIARAEELVLNAVEGGECLTLEAFAERFELAPGPKAQDPQEPARSLLNIAIVRLQAAGLVDLRTRKQIQEETGMTEGQLVWTLFQRKGAPSPVVHMRLKNYWRAEDVAMLG